ncbi:unnamed protein product [Blepharisma stoltei]|uniref:TLDc domain-containing protein n=1 Tax=Blepharisma stoltei TaxID=1481888 RepID=A0AAU9J116_9CILI|nr:unnamed protein product [Blepharisma stoltei]
MKALGTRGKCRNFAGDERLFYLGKTNDSNEDSSLVKFTCEDKKSPTHRSAFSIDEFKLKSLSTPNKPSHKRTISGTHGYFTELRNFENKSLPSDNQNQESVENFFANKYKNQMLPDLYEYDETLILTDDAEDTVHTDFPEQKSPLGLEDFGEIIEMIENKETEKGKIKDKKLQQLKQMLLGKVKNNALPSSISFSKNELLSTDRLSNLITSSISSNNTQAGPGSSILLNEPSIESPDYNHFFKGASKPVDNKNKIEEILAHVCKKNSYQINTIIRKINNAKWAKRFIVVFDSSQNAEDVGVYGKEFINFRKIDGSQNFPENIFKPQIECGLIYDESEQQLQEINSDEEADAVILYESLIAQK